MYKAGHSAKRSEKGRDIIIRYLPQNQGILMCRVVPIKKASGLTGLHEEEETFPHLGALFNNALKKGYFEVRRYAKDWQPLFYMHSDANKKQTARKSTLANQEEEDYSIEEDFTYIEWDTDKEDIQEEVTTQIEDLFPLEFLDEYDYDYDNDALL